MVNGDNPDSFPYLGDADVLHTSHHASAICTMRQQPVTFRMMAEEHAPF